MKRAKSSAHDDKLREHIGRFARRVAAQRKHAKNAESQAQSVPPPEPRDFGEIEKAVEEAMQEFDKESGSTRLRKKKVTFPDDAFFSKQRANSAGQRRLRFQGQLVQ